jgi:enoyl-CoA hydratase/carnithine racemase
MSDQIIVSAQDRVLTIAMNRPEKKNALSGAMYTAMTEALMAGDADSSIRALMIRGAEDCFTAGNDISDFAAARPGESSPAVRYLETLAGTAKPVLAAVSGVAIGIGTTMLLHCDLVYVTSDSRFQLPFVNLGLCPEAGSSLILPGLMGMHRAAELLLFGEPFGADIACKLGIVNQVVSAAELFPSVTAKAQQLAQKPPAALRTTKMLMKSGQAEAIRQAMAREGQNFAALLQGPEAKEAMAAFLERRKPDFSKF